MTKKRKDSSKKIEKDNGHEENNTNLPKKTFFKRIVQFLIWVFQWFTIVIFITVASVIVLGVYYTVKYSTTPAQLPKLDMDKYWGTYPMDPKQDLSIRPYKIEFSDMMINDLRERLLHQRLIKPPLEDSEFSYGFNFHSVIKVLDFWKNQYDFKERENFFNKYNHYVTTIDGLNIHYMHVQPDVSSDVKVLTLLMVHSWPSSIREFYEVIPKLATVDAKYKFVFEVIAPSLPGLGFSQAPERPGMYSTEMAIVISKLMDRIGRKTYYVHGGDIGHSVGSALATIFPNNVLGFHTSSPKIHHPMMIVRNVIAFIVPGFISYPEIPNHTYTLHRLLRRAFVKTGYLPIRDTKTDTVGIALNDSPAGLAAYVYEKLSLYNNPEYQQAESCFLRNKSLWTQLMDNVMVYWITNSIATSMRMREEYYDEDRLDLDLVVTDVPTWGLQFKDFLAIAPVSVLKKKYKNYLHTTVVDHDRAFVAMQRPGLLVKDIFAAVDAFVTFHAKNNTPQDTIPIEEPETIYDFSVKDIQGRVVQLNKYKGYVLLVVNVASQCGLTDKNYDQLTKLYDKYEGKGLRILAFPCNQFGSQEPGSPQDIMQFTKARGVKFDVFSKVDVNGDDAHPLWKFLKRKQSGTLGDWIKWNFSKFIVDRDGVPVERFGPDVNPLDLEPYIAKYTENRKHDDL